MTETKSTDRRGGKRSAARLAAVQALYQIDLNDGEAQSVVEEFTAHRLGAAAEEMGLAEADAEFFSDIVLGVTGRIGEIDTVIGGALDKSRTLDRLEHIMRALLRAGVYEMLARVDVPARVIISEYVDVAHAFFGGGEPGFANGVLDRSARQVRSGEVEGKDDGRPRQAG
jgi:N utilization substance protein B